MSPGPAGRHKTPTRHYFFHRKGVESGHRKYLEGIYSAIAPLLLKFCPFSGRKNGGKKHNLTL